MSTNTNPNQTAIVPAKLAEFHVTNEKTANWVLRRIIETRNYRARIAEWAMMETRRAERREQFLLHRFGAELEQWTRQRLASERGRKSVRLPGGILGFRRAPTRLEITDERRLLAWCQRNLPTAVKVVQHLLKSIIVDHAKQTGELPDGSEIAGGDERFFIK